MCGQILTSKRLLDKLNYKDDSDRRLSSMEHKIPDDLLTGKKNFVFVG